jgi:hypothetical protein
MEATGDDPTQKASSSRSRLTHALPTKRIAFTKQLEILRGYAVGGADGTPVTNRRLAQLVGMSHKTTSLANAFFLENEFLQRSEGGFRPSLEVISFQQAHQWNPEQAARELAPVLEDTWSARALVPQLQMKPVSQADAIGIIGRAANAGPESRQELGMVLEYLAAAGVVEFDGDLVRATDNRSSGGGSAAGGQRGRVADAEAARHEPPPIVQPSPSPGAGQSRGPLPLLIQGLLEQLPREGEWTRSKADQWLELARLTIDVVYQLDDEPVGRRATPRGEDER